MWQHQTETPRDVRADRHDCPHALADVCMRMLAKDPSQRFAAIGEVADRLRRWLQSQSESPTATLKTVHTQSLGEPTHRIASSNAPTAGATDGRSRLRSAPSAGSRRPRKLWVCTGLCIIAGFALLVLWLMHAAG
jgi:hypothetical protein